MIRRQLLVIKHTIVFTHLYFAELSNTHLNRVADNPIDIKIEDYMSMIAAVEDKSLAEKLITFSEIIISVAKRLDLYKYTTQELLHELGIDVDVNLIKSLQNGDQVINNQPTVSNNGKKRGQKVSSEKLHTHTNNELESDGHEKLSSSNSTKRKKTK